MFSSARTCSNIKIPALNPTCLATEHVDGLRREPSPSQRSQCEQSRVIPVPRGQVNIKGDIRGSIKGNIPDRHKLSLTQQTQPVAEAMSMLCGFTYLMHIS